MARSGLALLTAAVALSAGFALSTAPAAAQPTTAARWHVVYRYAPKDSACRYGTVAVWGTSSAWAVGGCGVAGNGSPTAAVYSRGRWSSTRMPSGPLGSIMTVSADGRNDAWAVASGVLHWHAGRWTVAKTFGPVMVPGPLETGITALSPTNVWVFSGTSVGQGAWHLTGHRWARVTGPGRDVVTASALSASSIWAIGGAYVASVLHYAHGRWRDVSTPAGPRLEFGAILAASANSIWVTARHGTDLELLHLAGTRWTAYPSPWPVLSDTGDIPESSIAADGRGGFWISGYVISRTATWLLHVSSTGKWSRVSLGDSDIGAVIRLPGSRSLLAVGSLPLAGNNAAAAVWAYN
jgi:hypothetical protein